MEGRENRKTKFPFQFEEAKADPHYKEVFMKKYHGRMTRLLSQRRIK